MAFLFGPFMGGLASGAHTGLDLYDKYDSVRRLQHADDDLETAKQEQKAKQAGQNGAGVPTAGAPDASRGPYGDAQYGSTAPKLDDSPIDTSGMPDPKKSTTPLLDAANAIKSYRDSSSGNYGPKWDAAAPQATRTENPQFNQGVSTSPSNMKTYDTQPGQPGALDGPSPPSIGQPRGSGPDMSHVTNRPVGAAIGDWLHGRNAPAPPVYTPDSARPPQAPQGQAVQARPPALRGGATPGAPTLANPSSNVGAAIVDAMGNTNQPGGY